MSSETGTGHRQLPLDIEEEVFRHLLFHKSIIEDEGDSYSRMDRYISVLGELKEGVHVTIRDSYSRSIAMVLELAVEEYLDPWDVDIIRFCRMFMKKINGSEDVNLMVVGKLIRMAYTVHLLKSNTTLLKAEMGEEEAEDIGDDHFHHWMEDDETFRVTRSIIREKDPILVESILHKGDRPVTLVDLLEALKDVSLEIDTFQEARKKRQDASRKIDDLNRSLINRKVYKENPEEEIRLTWQRINRFNGHPIPFQDISSGFELDETTTFVSLLFLAKQSKIRIWQRRFPYGEIFIRNLDPGGELRPGELEENERRVREGTGRIAAPGEIVVEKRPIPRNLNT